MRSPALPSFLVTVSFALAGALVPALVMAQAQPPASPPPASQPPASPPPASQTPASPPPASQTVAPGPYKAVPITLPPAMNDPAFADFRKQLGEIAQKKDRTVLARLVAGNFFWVPEESDVADKNKPAIDNVAKALGLGGTDPTGWEALRAYAAEATAMPDPQRAGVFCAPAEPSFDEKAADELANTTQTEAADWVFPVRDGVDVRSAAQQDAPVVDKLGLYLVRALPDDSPANAIMQMFVKVMTPSGKTGFVTADSVLSIGAEQLCYVKDASGWKIAGFLGGEANQ